MTASAISAENICYARPDGRPVLNGVNLSVGAGQTTAVIGRSGTGKSTLLRILSGFARPTSGRVTIAGLPLTAPNRTVALVFQNYDATVLDWLTVRENIQLSVPRNFRDASAPGVEDVAERLGLSAILNESAYQKSGGQRQRIAIARALVQGARIVLLDEPFASLDVLSRHRLSGFIQEVASAYRTTFVMVSHDIEEALLTSHQHLVLFGAAERSDQLVTLSEALRLEGEHGPSVQQLAAAQRDAARLLEVFKKEAGEKEESVAYPKPR